MVKFLEKLILRIKSNPLRFIGKKVGRQISRIAEENTSNELTAKNYWETNPTAGFTKQGYWLSNPIIEKAINHRLSGGNTQGYWLTWLVKKYFNNRRFDRLLSIGCGVGNHEILMAKLGLVTQIDAFDFSETSLEIATKDAAAAGVKINIYSRCCGIFSSNF